MLQLQAEQQQQQQLALQHQQQLQLQHMPLQQLQQPSALQAQLRPLDPQLPLTQQPNQYLAVQQQQQHQLAGAASYLTSYAQPLPGNPGIVSVLPAQNQSWNSNILEATPGMSLLQQQHQPQQPVMLAGDAANAGLHMPAGVGGPASSDLLLPGMACPHAPLLQPQPQQSWAPLLQQHVRRSSALEPQPQ
jgi:hypothetical protein